jgi:hypothetical protein
VSGERERPGPGTQVRLSLFNLRIQEDSRMKSLAILGLVAISALSFSPSAADAAGCIKGAVVGGVAGHYAAHHGLLGAGAGCLVGRHYAKKHAREQMRQDRYYDSGYRR